MTDVSNQDVDDYLAAVPEPQKTTLESVRATLAALLPEAEQGIAYGVPCFKVGGKGVAGFASYKNHCTYLPMSGSITAELADELSGFVTAKGSVQFATDEPLPADLVEHLVDARLTEIARSANVAVPLDARNGLLLGPGHDTVTG